MRKIKAKQATKKEIEFFINQITKLDVIEFIGIAKLCGVKLLVDEDAADEKDTEKKPEARDFYDIFADILDYYQNSKKEKRQFLVNLVADCVYESKKRGGKNGIKSENSTSGESISS